MRIFRSEECTPKVTPGKYAKLPKGLKEGSLYLMGFIEETDIWGCEVASFRVSLPLLRFLPSFPKWGRVRAAHGVGCLRKGDWVF